MPAEIVQLDEERERRAVRPLPGLVRHDGVAYAAAVVNGSVVLVAPSDAEGNVTEWWLGPDEAEALARELADLAREARGG